MQVAHINAGSGSAIRVDDRRAVICLCPLLHRLHVSDSTRVPDIKIGPQRWPTIDNGNAVWIKQYFDPEFYDRDFLEKIWNGTPPKPKPLEDFWKVHLMDNIGLSIK